MDENNITTETKKDPINQDLKPQSNRGVILSAAVIIFAAASIGTVLAIAPEVQKVSLQEQRLKDLEAEINTLRAAKETPPAMTNNITAQIETLQNKVDSLSTQAKSYASAINDLKSGTMEQRLNKLETHVNSMVQQASSLGLRNMVSRIEQLRNNPNGAAEIKHVVSSIINTGNSIKNGADEMVITVNKLREFDPVIATTFKDIAPEDTNTAVMLIAVSQIKHALNVDNTPFDNELKIIQMATGKNNTALQQAITDISPYAKSGVLTPKTLTTELNKIRESVIKASIKDEDNLQQKTLANIAEVIKIEKNGQLINGNATQVIMNNAQNKLNNGDISGAINLLNGLQGGAANAIKPFMLHANATVLGQQLQQILGQEVLSNLKNKENIQIYGGN